MIEELSKAVGRDVPRGTYEQLNDFASLLVQENQRQNLVAPNSVGELWTRHILDGAQLVALADRDGIWCDVGSGAGLPGLVVAILTGQPMTLIEPRRLRAEFLERTVAALNLQRVTVAASRVERITQTFDLITARAVARLDKLFSMACHLAHSETRWVLPKGESAKSELDAALGSWQGSFRLVPSRTHPTSAIIVAEHVQRRGKK